MSTEVSQSLYEIWRREPLIFKDALWPEVRFHEKQIEEILSVRDNVETYVHAGNMLGKDYVAAFIVWWFFVCHYKPPQAGQTILTECRIVTTSVKDDHLDVLWAEIAKFGASSRLPLLESLGGPFVMTNHQLVHYSEKAMGNPMNYVKGMVAALDRKESLQGHHATHNLFLVDEASGVPDWVYEMGQGWMKKMLAFGNPNSCSNWWYRGCKSGDLLA